MLTRKTIEDLIERLLRATPTLLIFIGPVLAFVGLLYFRHPDPQPAVNDPVPAATETAETPTQKKPADPRGLVALLEPLRAKVIRAKPEKVEQKTVARCAVSDPASGVVTVIEEDTPILLGPSAAAKPLKDWSGSQRFLDPRHDLKILEESGDWVRVSVVAPNWPPGNVGWSGWIERKNIQKPDAPEAKNCLFVDPGVWSALPEAVQLAAKTAALQILRQDDRCKRISRAGYLGNGQRFYLTCYPNDGAKPYHYWLSATNPRKDFAPSALVDEDTAMQKCRVELQKTLSGRALVERREAEDAQIDNFQARRSNSVYHISIDFRLGAEEAQKAFCVVAPGAGAEITLGDPSS